MMDKFLALSKEKQQRIINAGMEVFAKHEYKHASTDDIAAKAGISKGLLFYYFRNKQSFYMYLYECCYKIILEILNDDAFANITDFFDLLEYGSNCKLSILKKYPHILEFVLRAYYSHNETISNIIASNTQTVLNQSFETYFRNITWYKFKDGIDPSYVYQMLIWLTDGYLHECMRMNKPIDVDTIMKDFQIWKIMFKQMVYKEEYQ